MDTRPNNRVFVAALLAYASQIVSDSHVDIHMPSIKAIAEMFAVSRQAIYAKITKIRQALTATFSPAPSEPAESPQPDLEDREATRKLLLDRELQAEIRTYERDHGLVFAEHKGHLPARHRSFLVRLLRTWRERGLSQRQIARTVGVPLENLRRWDKEADDQGHFPRKPDRRGAHRKPPLGLIRAIIRAYEGLEEALTLEAFVCRFNRGRSERVSTHRISRILQAYGVRKARRRQRRGLPPERFRVYFPGAQLAIDGKKLRVRVDQEEFLVTCQAGIDIASGLILGRVIGREETAEGVRIVIQMSRDAMAILSVLQDNGKANQAAVDACEGMNVGPIFTFYYHPQTNGHIEGGLWSWYERVVGRIEIDASSPESIARSAADEVTRVFQYFANRLPRDRLNGLSPLAYARAYKPTDAEVERATEELREQRQRSERAHRKTPEMPAEKTQLIESLSSRWRFDPNDALRYLASYDRDLIAEADLIFAGLMNRRDWPAEKKSLRYFCGIVRKRQEARDDAAQNARAMERRAELVKLESAAKDRTLQEEEAAESARLETEPEAVAMEYLQSVAPTGFRLIPRAFWDRIERALRHLRARGRVGRERFREILAWLDLAACEPTRREDIRRRLREVFDEA